MSLRCRLGLHRWDGCECSACGAERDHVWTAVACETCGMIRPRAGPGVATAASGAAAPVPPSKWNKANVLASGSTRFGGVNGSE